MKTSEIFVSTTSLVEARGWRTAVIAALFLSPVYFAEHGWGADWPQWRGIDRDGVSAEAGLLSEWPEEGPRKLWSASVGIGASSLAVADGRVYTMGNDNDRDVVTALDAVSGKVVWEFDYPSAFFKRSFDGGTASTPSVDEGRVYTLSYKGDLYCLEAATGKVVWMKNLIADFGGRSPKWDYAVSPLVSGRMLIVESGARGGAVTALDKLTGKQLWKSGNYDPGYSSPVIFKVGKEDAVAVFHAFGLVGYMLENGRELWAYRWKTSWDVNAATPIVSNNYIFLSSGYGTGAAVIDVGSGSPEDVWVSKSMANQFSSSVLFRGNLYGFHGNAGRGAGSFRCVEFFTGKVNWEETGLGTGTVILVDGKLVVLSENGELVLVDADHRSYREIARMQVLGGRNWATPAYSDGRVFCRGNSGKLVVYELGRSGDDSDVAKPLAMMGGSR
jgi:outer membrane protein assembly factor BamB